MVRILYITRAKLSLSRAHNQNILKTAESLSEGGLAAVCVASCAGEPMRGNDVLAQKGIAPVFLLDVAPYARSVMRYIISQRAAFDVLYFRDPYLWPFTLFVRVVFRKKIVFEVHGSHEWKYQRPIWHAALYTAHGAIFITRALQHYYNTKKPSVIAPSYGVNLEQFRADVPTEKIRRDLSLPSDQKLVLYLGSLLWYSKEVLIGMMQFLPQDYTLVVAGAKDDEEKELRALAASSGVAGRVVVRPRIPAAGVPSYLLAADVLVNPLRIVYPGSISSKLYEYLAAGKPIVSSPGGANAEVITHEKTGLLVPLTAEDFARAVLRIQNEPQLAGMLAKNARESALSYTWEKRAARIIKLASLLVPLCTVIFLTADTGRALYVS